MSNPMQRPGNQPFGPPPPLPPHPAALRPGPPSAAWPAAQSFPQRPGPPPQQQPYLHAPPRPPRRPRTRTRILLIFGSAGAGLVILVLALVLSTAGGSGPKRLDQKAVETGVATILQQDYQIPTQPQAVSCPPDMQVIAGRSYTCIANGHPVTITIKNADNNTAGDYAVGRPQ